MYDEASGSFEDLRELRLNA